MNRFATGAFCSIARNWISWRARFKKGIYADSHPRLSEEKYDQVEIALAKGKKIYDHRETSRQRTIDREAQQDIHEHRRRHQ